VAVGESGIDQLGAAGLLFLDAGLSGATAVGAGVPDADVVADLDLELGVDLSVGVDAEGAELGGEAIGAILLLIAALLFLGRPFIPRQQQIAIAIPPA
jgi:hypothetical protein